MSLPVIKVGSGTRFLAASGSRGPESSRPAASRLLPPGTHTPSPPPAPGRRRAGRSGLRRGYPLSQRGARGPAPCSPLPPCEQQEIISIKVQSCSVGPSEARPLNYRTASCGRAAVAGLAGARPGAALPTGCLGTGRPPAAAAASPRCGAALRELRVSPRLYVHIWRWPPVPRNFPSCSPGGGPVTAIPGGGRGGAGAARSLAPSAFPHAPCAAAAAVPLRPLPGAGGRRRSCR